MRTWLLRRFSPTTYVLERIFFAAQYLSLANLFLGTRVGSQQQFTTRQRARAVTIRRGRGIELYVFCRLIVELALAVSLPNFSGAWLWLLVLAGYCVFDIMQAQVNLKVFDHLRIGARRHYVASIARTLLLSLWNFFELLLCLGIFYSSPLAEFKDVVHVSRLDAYYFSVVTQLTIGYGDITPLGLTRAVAAIQGLLGFIVALFALSRFVSFLPRTEPILRDD